MPWQGPRRITTAALRASRKLQVHAERLGHTEGEEQHGHEHQDEDGRNLAGREQQRASAQALTLFVMPLDGEEHGGDEDERLQSDEADRYPFHVDDWTRRQPSQQLDKLSLGALS